MRRKWALIASVALLALIMAVPVLSVYYDGYFTNALVKGNLNVQGSTENLPMNTAVLSGATGTITWGTDATSGNSGWFVSEANLKSYSHFLVETSHPSYANGTGDPSGATPYSAPGSGIPNAGCPTAPAASGETVYLVDVTEDLHGREWDFSNATGPTGFILFNKDQGFKNLASGTTHAPSSGGFAAGVTSIPAALGESVRVRAIYTPSTHRGYHVIEMNCAGADKVD